MAFGNHTSNSWRVIDIEFALHVVVYVPTYWIRYRVKGMGKDTVFKWETIAMFPKFIG